MIKGWGRNSGGHSERPEAQEADDAEGGVVIGSRTGTHTRRRTREGAVRRVLVAEGVGWAEKVGSTHVEAAAGVVGIASFADATEGKQDLLEVFV